MAEVFAQQKRGTEHLVMGNTGPGSWGQTAPEKVKTACEKSRIMSFVALEEVM